MRPAALSGILSRYWQENNRANRAESVALQNTDEEGSAAAIDNESYRIQRGYGATLPPYHPFSLPLLRGAVSRQSRYPLVALALSRVPACQIPTLTALAFVRDSPNAPWRVALEPLVSAGLMPRLAFAKGGFAEPVPADARLAVAPAGLAGYLAAAMTRFAYTNGPGTGLPVTLAPATKCWLLPDLSDEREAADGEGAKTTISVRPAYGAPLAWRIRGGGAFVLLSLKASVTFRAPNHGLLQGLTWIAIPVDPWLTVPVRNYHTVTFNIGVELAVLDPPAGHGRLRVIGADDGLLSGTGR